MMSNKKIRWGILATGSIARVFAADLKLLPEAELTAVGSRIKASADKFADEFDIPLRFGSYAELAACPDVDAIYIATPHPFHKENTVMCLNAGKAVLCEKPFAMNAREAQEMIDAAKSNGVFLMEAMWVRFTPLFQKVRQWVTDGLIGNVRLIQSDFGFHSKRGVDSRVFRPDLGGGSLLDVGIYPISMASFIYGCQPETIQSSLRFGHTGVDEQAAMIFSYNGGKMAVLSSAITLWTQRETLIFGTKGFIHIYGPWHQLQKVCVHVNDEDTIETFPRLGRGYGYQALEVMNCLREKRTESTIMPLSETLEIIKTLDTIRSQWNFKYPTE